MLTLTVMYKCFYNDSGCHPKQMQFSGKMFSLCLGSTWFKSFLILGVFVNDHHMQQCVSESFRLVYTLFFKVLYASPRVFL